MDSHDVMYAGWDGLQFAVILFVILMAIGQIAVWIDRIRETIRRRREQRTSRR